MQFFDAFSGCNLSLRSCLGAGHFWRTDKLIKKCAVMNHGLAQFFRTGLAVRLTKGDGVGGAVIFENQRVAHRDIRRTLFKVTYRIPARGHHIAQELIGFRHRTSRAVNEARLHPAPGLDETSPIGRTERPDVETLHPICALIEPRFGLPPAVAFLESAIIFSAAKLSAEFSTAALSEKTHDGEGHDDNHNHATDDN
jgi:hypothetical protein